MGIEERYYLSGTYSRLGAPDFDIARATFLSVGYYATKSMVDANGDEFKPGFFARACLTYDLWGPRCYLYADAKYISARSLAPTLLNFDAGIAARPFHSAPRLEFRAGTQDVFDLKGGDPEFGFYISIRYVC